MATHSSVLAWRIPGMGEPGGLLSLGSHSQTRLKQLSSSSSRTDAEAEAPIFWPPDGKSQLTGKDPDAGTDWGQEKGTTEDELAGWHHLLEGHEFE